MKNNHSRIVDLDGLTKDQVQKNAFEKILNTWNWEELLEYAKVYYRRQSWWKYCRLASGLISNAYLNIGKVERNYLLVERATSEIASQIIDQKYEADVIVWAQMWSVRISLKLAEKLWVQESIYTEKSWDNNENMSFRRHKIDLTGKKIILSEDIITKWSTITKMIQLVADAWWEVIAITCIGNRYGKEIFEWIPVISCFSPEKFEMYFDEKTPVSLQKTVQKIPKWWEICESPKNSWEELTKR
jgi:orotate phosphoribosyltransferase